MVVFVQWVVVKGRLVEETSNETLRAGDLVAWGFKGGEAHIEEVRLR